MTKKKNRFPLGGGLQRNLYITFRTTQETKDKALKAAERAGMNLSAYMDLMLLKQLGKVKE